jgi:hypothetical protein
MKKGIRCIMVVLLISTLTFVSSAVAATVSNIASPSKPCIECRDGTTVKVRVGKTVQFLLSCVETLSDDAKL